MAEHNILFLIGMRASGKTTLGRILAKRLNWKFADTDALIRESSGLEVADIVAAEGWAGFRDLEARMLCAAAQPNTVVATGGGVVLREDNRNFMRRVGFCVYLDADCDELCRRQARDPKLSQRPPLISPSAKEIDDGEEGGRKAENTARRKEVRTVLAEREIWYRQTAHRTVDAARPARELVEELLLLAEQPE